MSSQQTSCIRVGRTGIQYKSAQPTLFLLEGGLTRGAGETKGESRDARRVARRERERERERDVPRDARERATNENEKEKGASECQVQRVCGHTSQKEKRECDRHCE